jgi:hypothetical protein
LRIAAANVARSARSVMAINFLPNWSTIAAPTHQLDQTD